MKCKRGCNVKDENEMGQMKYDKCDVSNAMRQM